MKYDEIFPNLKCSSTNNAENIRFKEKIIRKKTKQQLLL